MVKLSPITRIDLAHSDLDEILERVHHEFIRQGWTYKGLALEAEVAPQTISNWFCGYTKPQAAKLCQVARAMGFRLTITRSN